MVALAVVQAPIDVDVHLVAAHDLAHGERVEIIVEQLQVIIGEPRVRQIHRETAEREVVEGIQLVEVDALLLGQLHAIGVCQKLLRRRQERARHVVDDLELGTALAPIPSLVELADVRDGALEDAASALVVGVFRVEIRKRHAHIGPHLGKHVKEMLVFRLLLKRQVRADDHLLGDLGTFAQEPLAVGMQLRRAARHVERLVTA